MECSAILNNLLTLTMIVVCQLSIDAGVRPSDGTALGNQLARAAEQREAERTMERIESIIEKSPSALLHAPPTWVHRRATVVKQFYLSTLFDLREYRDSLESIKSETDSNNNIRLKAIDREIVRLNSTAQRARQLRKIVLWVIGQKATNAIEEDFAKSSGVNAAKLINPTY